MLIGTEKALTSPGASSSAVAFDSLDAVGASHPREAASVNLCAYTTVADMAWKHEWSATNTGALVQIATGTYAASTPTPITLILAPGRNKISIITTTNPAAFQACVSVSDV